MYKYLPTQDNGKTSSASYHKICNAIELCTSFRKIGYNLPLRKRLCGGALDSSSNPSLLQVRSSLNALGVLAGVPSCIGSTGGSAVSFETHGESSSSIAGDGGVTTGVSVQADPPCSPGVRGLGSNALLLVSPDCSGFKKRRFLIVTLPEPSTLTLYCQKGKISTIFPVRFNSPLTWWNLSGDFTVRVLSE